MATDKIFAGRKVKPIWSVANDDAFSAAYAIAAATERIYLSRTGGVGSIGVIAVSPNLRGLFQKIGIDMNVIKSGKYKDILSSFRDLRPEERELIQEIIDASYHKFLKDVALGRNQNESDIEPIADGRVMSGETALKYKLVDMLGTFEDAIDKARQMAKLSEDSPVYEEMKSPFEQMFFRMEGMFRGGSLVDQGLRSLEQENNYRIEYRYLP